MQIKWLHVSGLVLATMILAVSVVRAREDLDIKDELRATDSAVLAGENQVLEVEEVHYYLPYPGLLPDHFLYPIKMIRDRVALFLTTDRVARAKLLELYADKRLGAARVLLEGGKIELGIDTGAKAIAYQTSAVSLAEEVKKEGKDEGELFNQLERATAKHTEVWGILVEKVGDPGKSRMNEYKDKVMELNKRMQRVLGRE